ncbi:MAG: GLPGLI family protein [Bacteroidota bacterium]
MKFLKVILFILLPTLTFAQETEGMIIYELTVDMHRNLTGDRERLKRWIPKTMVKQYQLNFNQGASMFKEYVNLDEEPEGGSSGRSRMRYAMGAATMGDMYQNFEDMRFVNSRELSGKKYLIKGDIEQTPWKITGQSREIAGYPCMQAIYDDELENKALTAWFTPSIPVSAGPGIYGQLPGLIVALDINNGEQVYRPMEIKFETPDKKDMAEPKKGKNVTDEEFTELLKEVMQQMREQRQAQRAQGSGGRPGGE